MTSAVQERQALRSDASPKRGRRNILNALAALVAASALTLAGAGVANAATITSGEYDFVSASTTTSGPLTFWNLRSYDHGTNTPFATPADGWELPASQGGLIPGEAEDEDNPEDFPVSGGGFRNETGTAATLTLFSVSYTGSGTGSLTISGGSPLAYSWTAGSAPVNTGTSLGANYHGHYNWQFGDPGSYVVTFLVSSGVNPLPDTQTYKFIVN